MIPSEFEARNGSTATFQREGYGDETTFVLRNKTGDLFEYDFTWKEGASVSAKMVYTDGEMNLGQFIPGTERVIVRTRKDLFVTLYGEAAVYFSMKKIVYYALLSGKYKTSLLLGTKKKFPEAAIRFEMDTSAAVYDQILEAAIATRNYTRKVLDELPRTVQERQKPEVKSLSSSSSEEVIVSPSQQSTIPGRIVSYRPYRSLSKKHVVILQEIDLKKPMCDEKMTRLKKKLQQQPVSRKQSESSLIVDYVPSEPKIFSHLRI